MIEGTKEISIGLHIEGIHSLHREEGWFVVYQTIQLRADTVHRGIEGESIGALFTEGPGGYCIGKAMRRYGHTMWWKTVERVGINGTGKMKAPLLNIYICVGYDFVPIS